MEGCGRAKGEEAQAAVADTYGGLPVGKEAEHWEKGAEGRQRAPVQ